MRWNVSICWKSNIRSDSQVFDTCSSIKVHRKRIFGPKRIDRVRVFSFRSFFAEIPQGLPCHFRFVGTLSGFPGRCHAMSRYALQMNRNRIRVWYSGIGDGRWVFGRWVSVALPTCTNSPVARMLGDRACLRSRSSCCERVGRGEVLSHLSRIVTVCGGLRRRSRREL